MDILGQSALLVGVTSFGSGLSVLSRNFRNKLYLSFALVTTLISGWALAFFLENIWPDVGFYRLHLVFNILLAPVGLNLIRVLVRIGDVYSTRLFQVSVGLTTLLSIAVLFELDHLSVVLLMIYFSPGLIVFQVLQLIFIDQKMRKGMARLPRMPTAAVGKRSLIYLGALVVLCTSVMDHVPFMGRVLPSFGNFGLAIYVFFLSQAISQQRLLNFGALLARFMVLVSVAFTLSVVYALPVAWIENSPGLFFLNSFIASFLLLTLLDPLRNFVGYVTQRLVSPRQQRLQERLKEAQRKLTGIVDVSTLFQVILNTAEQILAPESAALFVLRSDGTKFRKMRELVPSSAVGPGLETISPVVVPMKSALKEVLANHPLVRYSETLARSGKFPIILDQILENEMERSASRVQREECARLIEGLKALGSNMLIPLMDSGKMLGFVVLQVPSPPEPWGSHWGLLPLVYPFFDQAAQMMQRMEIFARQREKERLAALGEMAAGLAHEIRNPLGAIKGAAQYLDPSSDRPESRFLGVIIEEVDRLNKVVTQFLDYSKPSAVDFKTVNIVSLVEKTLDLLRPGITPGVELEFHSAVPPSKVKKAVVLASAGQIQQVLINLIQNANHAVVGKTPGMIRVSVGVIGEVPFGEVEIAVEDTGVGIEKEHLDKLFIPFFTTSPSGTGLGLSISQKIVEAHRGRFEVASEPGLFTRFSVILPLAKS